jgi:phage host-nuclease inhibitor protein Gam
MTRTKTKTKAPAIAVPQTYAEADAALARHGLLARELAAIETRMKARLAATKAAFEADAKPLQDEQIAVFEGLQAWASANRSRLTDDGKSKSVSLAAGTVGWRMRPPSVTLRRGVAIDEFVQRIRELRLFRFLRTKVELDKEAMLKDPDAAERIEGVTVGSKGEEFFVEPFAPDLAAPVAPRRGP